MHEIFPFDHSLASTGEDIALLAGLAGLFHDLGKANVLFQQKLRGKGKSFEAFRHEWLSLRLF
jgi:CRISPR-associated endonuclease/helicase Cas3